MVLKTYDQLAPGIFLETHLHGTPFSEKEWKRSFLRIGDKIIMEFTIIEDLYEFVEQSMSHVHQVKMTIKKGD